MSASFLPEAQRRLFYGIWTVVALAIALWAVPGPNEWSHDRLGAPKIVFAPEVRAMFTHGRVVEAPAESFLVEVELDAGYQSTVPTQGRDFALGYQLRKSGTVLRHALLQLRIRPVGRQQFRLPNPDRSHPTDILLGLVP